MNTTALNERKIEVQSGTKSQGASVLKTIVSIIVTVCLVTAAFSAAALGLWAYSLNTRLAQVQSDYQALKTSNEKLTGDFNDLNSGSSKTNADLATAQAQIESLKKQLEKAQAENSSLNGTLTAIQAKISLIYSFEFTSDEIFGEKVDASGDARLKELFEKAKKTKTTNDYWNLQDYLVQSLADSAGLSLFSNQVASTG